MAITAGNVLDRVRKKLNDVGDVRWTLPEHLEAVNDGQRAILEARPDLFEVYVFHNLEVGPVQDVPANCYFLFDVVANAENNTLKEPITKVDRTMLERQTPNWLGLEADKIVIHWCQAPRERNKFWVVPPQPAADSGRVYLRHAKYPDQVSAEGQALDAPDECLNPLYHFAMHRALEKDEKFSGSPQSQFHWQKWAQYIGARVEGEQQATMARDSREQG